MVVFYMRNRLFDSRIMLCYENVWLNSVNMGLVRFVIYVMLFSSVRWIISVSLMLRCCVCVCCVLGSLLLRIEMKIRLLMLSMIFIMMSVRSVV